VNELVFIPKNEKYELDFLKEAHRETFEFTFKIEMKDEWLENALTKQYDVSDCLYKDDQIIGICDLQRNYIEGIGECCHVAFYYIASDFRNQGLGNLLIEHTVEWCLENGIKTIDLRTAKDNIQAQKSYEKNGFIRYSQRDTEDEYGYIKYIDFSL
jgi:ribosomal protein S18 acetylase RimI-like enzyme